MRMKRVFVVISISLLVAIGWFAIVALLLTRNVGRWRRVEPKPDVRLELIVEFQKIKGDYASAVVFGGKVISGNPAGLFFCTRGNSYEVTFQHDIIARIAVVGERFNTKACVLEAHFRVPGRVKIIGNVDRLYVDSIETQIGRTSPVIEMREGKHTLKVHWE